MSARLQQSRKGLPGRLAGADLANQLTIGSRLNAEMHREKLGKEVGKIFDL